MFNNGKIEGVQTSRGNIKTKKVGLCVAGSTTLVSRHVKHETCQLKHTFCRLVSQNQLNQLLHNVVTFGAGHFLL